jgi:hypothetical protein
MSAPTPDGEAVKETRALIRELIENGETALCEIDAVTTKRITQETDYRRKTIQRRIEVDESIKKTSAIDPETHQATYAWYIDE